MRPFMVLLWWNLLVVHTLPLTQRLYQADDLVEHENNCSCSLKKTTAA